MRYNGSDEVNGALALLKLDACPKQLTCGKYFLAVHVNIFSFFQFDDFLNCFKLLPFFNFLVTFLLFYLFIFIE